MALAASIAPVDFNRAFSIWRAKRNHAGRLKGTKAAFSPMVVPTKKRVVTAKSASKMMKGTERITLIALSKNLINKALRQKCPWASYH